MLGILSSLTGGGALSGASSPGDVYVTPTVNIGGINGSPLRDKGLSGLDPVTKIALAVVGGVLLWVVLRK